MTGLDSFIVLSKEAVTTLYCNLLGCRDCTKAAPKTRDSVTQSAMTDEREQMREVNRIAE
jgi:hypothetical protein